MQQITKLISTLQSAYNVLVVYHKSEPENKKIFVTNSFIPIQNSVHFLDVRGRDITDIVSDGSLYTHLSLSRQTGMSDTEIQKTQIDNKIELIPIKHYQFSPDYTWEWYLSA